MKLLTPETPKQLYVGMPFYAHQFRVRIFHKCAHGKRRVGTSVTVTLAFSPSGIPQIREIAF